MRLATCHFQNFAANFHNVAALPPYRYFVRPPLNFRAGQKTERALQELPHTLRCLAPPSTAPRAPKKAGSAQFLIYIPCPMQTSAKIARQAMAAVYQGPTVWLWRSGWSSIRRTSSWAFVCPFLPLRQLEVASPAAVKHF
jgi:hypothetical protein